MFVSSSAHRNLLSMRVTGLGVLVNYQTSYSCLLTVVIIEIHGAPTILTSTAKMPRKGSDAGPLAAALDGTWISVELKSNSSFHFVFHYP